MINFKTIFYAAMLGLALTGQSSADAIKTPILGGPGGGKFKDMCSANMYLVGFKYWSGSALDSVRPLCRRTTDNGNWKGNDWRGDRWGGNGGTPEYIYCADDQYVTSLHVRWDGSGIVHSFDLNCHSFDRIDKSKARTFTSGGVPTDDAGTSCPIGEFAVGIRGRSGSLVDALGLFCDKPDTD